MALDVGLTGCAAAPHSLNDHRGVIRCYSMNAAIFIFAPYQGLCLSCSFLFSRVFDLSSVFSREEAGEPYCDENSHNVSHCAYCRCYTALTFPSRGRCEQRTVFARAILDRNRSRHRSNMYEILVKNFRQKPGMG